MTSQTITSVGTSVNGTSMYHDASGISSMSDSWMAPQPRIDEPSMPKPSSNDASLNWSMGYETWGHRPGRSGKRRSRTFTSLSFTNFMISLGSAIPCSFAAHLGGVAVRCLQCLWDKFAHVWTRLAQRDPELPLTIDAGVSGCEIDLIYEGDKAALCEAKRLPDRASACGNFVQVTEDGKACHGLTRMITDFCFCL